jgi:DNA-binding LacI/PurR family transcriptional regulator
VSRVCGNVSSRTPAVARSYLLDGRVTDEIPQRATTGRRVTIRDVAREAGVSVTTVSTALSGGGRMGAQTRQRVEAVAAGLGYSPSPSARHLRTARTGSIGLCLPDQVLALEYYMQLAFGAAEAAMAQGLSLTLVPAQSSRNPLSATPVDGMIVVDPVEDDPTIAALVHAGIPIVTCEEDPTGTLHSGAVIGDHRNGAKALLEHLAGQGAGSIAMIAPPPTSSWSAAVRSEYQLFCRVRDAPDLLVTVPFISTISTVRTATHEILDHLGVDAIVAMPDGGAAGAWQAATARGYRVPSDLLIAAGVDSTMMELSAPPITALDLHPRQMGAEAAVMLSAALDGRQQENQVTVPVVLRQRASTLRTW